jgi:hypothetical protein
MEKLFSPPSATNNIQISGTPVFQNLVDSFVQGELFRKNPQNLTEYKTESFRKFVF